MFRSGMRLRIMKLPSLLTQISFGVLKESFMTYFSKYTHNGGFTQQICEYRPP